MQIENEPERWRKSCIWDQFSTEDRIIKRSHCSMELLGRAICGLTCRDVIQQSLRNARKSRKKQERDHLRSGMTNDICQMTKNYRVCREQWFIQCIRLERIPANFYEAEHSIETWFLILPNSGKSCTNNNILLVHQHRGRHFKKSNPTSKSDHCNVFHSHIPYTRAFLQSDSYRACISIRCFCTILCKTLLHNTFSHTHSSKTHRCSHLIETHERHIHIRTLHHQQRVLNNTKIGKFLKEWWAAN